MSVNLYEKCKALLRRGNNERTGITVKNINRNNNAFTVFEDQSRMQN